MRQESDVPSDDSGSPTPAIAPEMQPCPKCQGEMVEGWVPEYLGQYLTPAIPGWYPGPPGVKEGLFHTKHVAPPDRDGRIPLSAFRCVRCGFLEFYARPKDRHLASDD